ncbi:MAG TPA: hypothetical protein VNO74_05910 [Methylomirabilota bacterium]|nr:hypothetical protein [Methylomirabilota bacterium]
MAGEALKRGYAGSILGLQILLFLFSLAVFLAAPVVQVSDSRYTALLSESFLHHRSAELDEYYKVQVPWLTGDTSRPEDANEYQLVQARGHVTYFFGHGSSMLSIPLVAAMNAVGISAATSDGRLNLAGEIRIERVIASVLMAGLTCVFFATAAMLLPVTWSIVVALGAALGSQILSTASRGLWAHTWEIFLLGLIAHSILSAEHRGIRLRPVWLATLVAWTYCVRPTGAIAIVAVSIYVLWLHRRVFIAYSAILAGWLAAFVGYSWSVFGTIVPPYYSASRLGSHTFTLALFGNLVSPSRGLLVFVPSTLFVLYLLARYGKHFTHRPLALLAFVQIIALEILMCANRIWHGGYCYGPRFFTDAIPWFVLLAILGLDAMRRAPAVSQHRMEIAAAIFLLVVSVTINARGAWSFAPMDWNLSEAASRLHGIFDWRYPQFMAGLIDPPKN